MRIGRQLVDTVRPDDWIEAEPGSRRFSIVVAKERMLNDVIKLHVKHTDGSEANQYYHADDTVLVRWKSRKR